jgi:hypothetical protein
MPIVFVKSLPTSNPVKIIFTNRDGRIACQPAKFAGALQHTTPSGKLVSFREPGTFAELYILCFTLALSFHWQHSALVVGFYHMLQSVFSLVIIILVTGFCFLLSV